MLDAVLTRVALTALAFLAIAAFGGEQPPRAAPIYSATSIANLADGEPGKLCPNSLAVIMGTDLANGVWARQPSDLLGDLLPTVLPGTGVTVKVNGLLAAIEYASPTAVVFLVPSEMQAGNALIVLTRNSVNGPSIRLQLPSACPALFLRGDDLVLGRYADSQQWLEDSRPVAPGEEIVLYASGLGPTSPATIHRKMPAESAGLAAPETLQVFLNDSAIPPDRVAYAGALPGSPGLYEIRLRLPDELPPEAQIRLCIGDTCSRLGVRINSPSPPMQPDIDFVRSIQ
jgi:uncharacterized protein (TIGR03437 family)